LGATLPVAVAHYALFQILIEQKELNKATQHLKKVRQMGERMKSVLFGFMVHLAYAQLSISRSDEKRTIKYLRRAMALGKEKGYLNFWIWRPQVMTRLCGKALEHGIESEYAKLLIKKRNLSPNHETLELEDWPWPIKIYTLGRFSIVLDGKPIRFQRKAQQKPMTLLKVLIALGGREIPEEEITDALWPDADGDRAHEAFATTLQRLRRTIGMDGALILGEGRLTLNPKVCWVDTWAFERFLGRAEHALKGNEIKEAVWWFEKAEQLYQGNFLCDEHIASWGMRLRERLRNRLLRQISALGDTFYKTKAYKQATIYYQKGIEVDDLVEELYQSLMKTYEALGRHAEALSTYQGLKKKLSDTFGISPSSKSEAIYRSILKD